MVLIVTAATLVSAQQATSGSATASRDDILKLFEVMHLRQQMRLVMDSVSKQQTALVHETVQKRYPKITQAQMDRLDSIMREAGEDFPVEDMLDDVVPIYQKHLTKADVDAMSNFYSSPTGQKILNEMPAMTSESMQASYQRMQKHMEAVMERIEKSMREEQSQKPAPKPQPKPQPESRQN
ncbi:MAG TPA: DUF2059 domain-containing protein [Terriglobales bacterium]|jgi:hypothetical protein